MTRHTIILPTSLRRAFDQWWAQSCPELPLNNALDHAINRGLIKPHATKRELTRHHIGLDMRGAKPFNALLPDRTWAAIHNHQLNYGITSRGEAVRELMRLGLGLAQPLVPRKLGIEPSSVPKMARILQLADEGLGPTEIGRELGITRQRVSFVLQQARKGKGGVGQLAQRKGVTDLGPEGPSFSMPLTRPEHRG